MVHCVTSTRECAQVALSEFNDVATSFGLTINFSQTNLLVCRPGVSEADFRPLLVNDREVECVSSFVYLGCLMTPDGRTGAELVRGILSPVLVGTSQWCVWVSVCGHVSVIVASKLFCHHC